MYKLVDEKIKEGHLRWFDSFERRETNALVRKD